MPDDSPTYLTLSRLIRARTALWRAVDARPRERRGVPLTDATPLQILRALQDHAAVDAPEEMA